METIAFRVWYSDHAETGVSYEDWVNLPDDDVQVVMLYFGNKNRQIAIGNDYYALNEKLELTQGDVLEDMVGHVKYGAWTDDENVSALHDMAMEDYELDGTV